MPDYLSSVLRSNTRRRDLASGGWSLVDVCGIGDSAAHLTRSSGAPLAYGRQGPWRRAFLAGPVLLVR